MFLFLFIFTLLGMQLYGGNLSNIPGGLPRQNFDSFIFALITVFQLLTLESWDKIMFNLMICPVNKGITVIYLIVWIFVSHYILLNLMMAIMLDAFIEQDQEQEEED